MEDIHLLSGGFRIDDRIFTMGQAIEYLEKEVGFTRAEVIQFLKSLPPENTNIRS